MFDSLSKIQRQLLALLILGVLIISIFTLVAAPIMSLNSHYQDSIDLLEKRLQILQRKVATGNQLRSRHDQLKSMLANNQQYLKSPSEALAAADLQGIIKRIAISNRLELQSTQTLPAKNEMDFTGITLKVRVRGKLANLVTVFHTLETGQPYLFIDNLSIRSRIQHSRKINFEAAPQRQQELKVDLVEMLDVEFDLTGYMPRK